MTQLNIIEFNFQFWIAFLYESDKKFKQFGDDSGKER